MAVTAPLILLVEDNPLTRNVLRDILLSGGYEVLEAGDGRTALELARTRTPALILQDMALPDMGGRELMRALRDQPGGGCPIVALSGLPGELQKAQGEEGTAAGFTDFLTKPIGASALLLAVQAYATAGESREATPGLTGVRPRVLVVEGPDPAGSLGFPLDQAGFEVMLAGDGAEALEAARRRAPDALVSAILVPGLDGFRLCREFRRDPALAAVPVILVSSSFTGPGDRDLAHSVGASALLPRPGRPGEVSAAVREALRTPVPAVTLTPGEFERRHAERVLAALHRTASDRADLARRLAFQSSAMALLGVLGESLSRPEEMARTPEEMLARCLTAAGTSQGAAFLWQPDGSLLLSAQIGFPASRGPALARFFGREDLLCRARDSREPVVVPSAGVDGKEAERLLEQLGAKSVLLAPLHIEAEAVGVLVMVSAHHDLVDWIDLSRSVSFQISQAIALGRTVARLAESERLLRERSAASLERFSADITHRFNELLTAIAGRGELLERGLAAEPDLRAQAAAILEAVACAGRMAAELRTLGRPDRDDARPVAIDAPVGRVEEDGSGPDPGPGGETILLVDDEEAVRSLMAETLRLEGFTVLEAPHGEAALEQAGAHDGEIHLLVSDLRMPRLGGAAVAERMRRERPGLRILFVSGFPDPGRDPEHSPGGMPFLQKPFTPSALLARVRAVLAAPPPGSVAP